MCYEEDFQAASISLTINEHVFSSRVIKRGSMMNDFYEV
jgi:hypothetical protein